MTVEAATPASASQIVRTQWRRWRAPALLVAFILVGGLVIAALQTGPPVTGALDPRDTGPGGAHALVALLDGRGQSVTRVQTVDAALSQAQGPGVTLVVTSPGQLSPAALLTLTGADANLVLVAPGRDALSILTPQVTLAGVAPTRSLPAMCSLPAARLAGSASMGGALLRTTAPGAWACYQEPGAGAASLIRYSFDGRTTTVLGTGAPFTNQALGEDGNAALAMDLLDSGHQIVWLVPSLPAAAAPAGGGSRPAAALIPPAVYLVVLELLVALALTAGWRIRRFGPPVSEPLPVVVRASETVRGHGRLYRARRARGRAAAVLRAAALARMAARLGLPAWLPPTAVAHELAGRAGRETTQVQAILFGPAPADDASLVALATDLDTLEGQVLSH